MHRQSARSDRWLAIRAALTAPRDAAALVAFRVGLGGIVLVSALRFLSYGWIDEMFIRPRVHFSYWGFSWIPLPSPAVTYGLFVAMALLGALVTFGLLYRAAVAALFVVFTYLQLVDVANYLNHYYLVSLLAGLMFFIPAHRAYSVDAWLRPTIRCAALPAWCTYLLQFQVAIVYFNAGLAKATSDWLLHAQPMRIWLSARSGLPLIGAYLDLPAVAYGAAWAGFLFDTTIAFFLMWRRARPYAYVAVIAFHLMTHLLFPPIGMFPVIMVVAALVFFDASWPRRVKMFIQRLSGRADPRDLASVFMPPAAPPPSAAISPVGTPMWGGVAAAGLFALVQIIVPLRGHFYGGNVLWHEQGMRFSWRVMSRAKNGSVTFNVRDPASGRQWEVAPAEYLTRQQEREMSVQPDLILQLAHHIAGDFANKGSPGVEVRADARASLNGRRAERLVDPSVDLARESDGIGRQQWITKGPTDAPPDLRPIRAWGSRFESPAKQLTLRNL